MATGETDHGNTEATVEGELDASWSSDLKDRDVKSSPPPGDGVEYATPPAEQQGEEGFEFLPDGVERDDLTDLQAEVIKTAVLHEPESYSALADAVDCSNQTVRKTLRDYAPDLAERVKMDRSEACRVAAVSRFSDDDDDDDDPEPEPTTTTADGYGDSTAGHPAPKLPPRRVERAIDAAETVEAVSENLEARKAARRIREILEGEEGER